MISRIDVAMFALGLFALAGCGEAEPEKLNLPLLGDHKLTMTLMDYERPVLPSGAIDENPLPVGDTHEEMFCVTSDYAGQGFKPMLDKGVHLFTSEDATCGYDRYDVSGEELDAGVTCRGGDGEIVMKFSMSGTVGSQASDVTMRIESEHSSDPMNRFLIGMHFESQWQGECLEQMFDRMVDTVRSNSQDP